VTSCLAAAYRGAEGFEVSPPGIFMQNGLAYQLSNDALSTAGGMFSEYYLDKTLFFNLC
jgi:hypothetical protein